MKFLVPSGGVTDPQFGILTSYRHMGIPSGILCGLQWAGDNNCMKSGFKPDLFMPWLLSMLPYRKTCIFIVVPDVLGNAAETLCLYEKWALDVRCLGFPVAFVAQDGQEGLAFPSDFDALFIGGTTEWKESQGAIDCIRRAQELKKHIHIGRVNWGRRYRIFDLLEGSDGFTCDGTRTRYDGVEKTIIFWKAYMGQKSLFSV